MLISSKSSTQVKELLDKGENVYCSGLFLSARWFVMSGIARDGFHVVVLPDKESAEYCAADLYNLIEGDRVFFLPDLGKNLERSNYRATLRVQRTSALSSIAGYSGDGLLVIVTYLDALDEGVPAKGKIRESVLKLSVGDEISHESIRDILAREGFEKVDFVAEPGQFALRGGIVDIFSYSFNNPFRISFFGDDIESINVFDCNTQLSLTGVGSADIYPDIVTAAEDEHEESLPGLFPSESVIWLDSSDMYRTRGFYSGLEKFRKVFFEVPLGEDAGSAVKFGISPQPVFNKNFELLTEDIRKRMEEGYRVVIFGEKESQLERLKSILSQNGGLIP